MRHVQRFQTLVIVALLLCAAIAFADAANVQQSSWGGIAPYIPILLPLLASLGTMLRGWTPSDGFFHTKMGHAVIALLGALCGATISFLQKGDFSNVKQALIMALGGAVAAFFGAFKPIGKDPVDDLSATTASGSGTGAKQAGMLAVLVIAFLGLGAPTCQNGTQALGKCELNALPATLQTVVATIVQIAFDSSKTVADLENAAGKLAPDQYNCAVAAVTGWLGKQVPPHGQADPKLVAALGKLNSYLAKHPATACRDWPRL